MKFMCCKLGGVWNSL